MDEFNTKIIAMYLPQFHEVPENSEWWGEGYTEWTAVKCAEPLFDSHDQPKVPLEENYYDLMKYDVMRWQADLMNSYNIDGLCFYHYYFKDGKKILEKPAENLLKWKDINMPFFFCWANESWKRTWSKFSGNQWAPKFDNTNNSEGTGLLVKQEYGNEEQWIEHLEYLLPFFNDDRYIKQNGHPVFMIYIPEEIPCLFEMMQVWNSYMDNMGLKKPYYICRKNGNLDLEKQFDAVMFQEPHATLSEAYVSESINWSEKPRIHNANIIWEVLINKNYGEGTVCIGAFNGHDDTPRKGRNGFVVPKVKPDDFYYYMCRLLSRTKELDCPFLFYNAWNEWGEGMYLEPDQKYGFDYLNALKKARETFDGKIHKTYEDKTMQRKILEHHINNVDRKLDKAINYEKILDKWIQLRRYSLWPQVIFEGKKIEHLGIYGQGKIGKLLEEDLLFYKKCGGVLPGNIFFIDSNPKDTWSYPSYKFGEVLPESDLIIVTVASEYYSIKKSLERYTNCPIVSVDYFLNEAIRFYEENHSTDVNDGR